MSSITFPAVSRRFVTAMRGFVRELFEPAGFHVA